MHAVRLDTTIKVCNKVTQAGFWCIGDAGSARRYASLPRTDSASYPSSAVYNNFIPSACVWRCPSRLDVVKANTSCSNLSTADEWRARSTGSSLKTAQAHAWWRMPCIHPQLSQLTCVSALGTHLSARVFRCTSARTRGSHARGQDHVQRPYAYRLGQPPKNVQTSLCALDLA